jgi:hypothetical protein
VVEKENEEKRREEQREHLRSGLKTFSQTYWAFGHENTINTKIRERLKKIKIKDGQGSPAKGFPAVIVRV